MTAQHRQQQNAGTWRDLFRRGKQGRSHMVHLSRGSTKTITGAVCSSGDVQLAQAEQTPFCRRDAIKNLPRTQQNRLLPAGCLRMQPAAVELVAPVAV